MMSKSEIRKLESKARFARTLAGEAAAKAAWAFADGDEVEAKAQLAEVERLARAAGRMLAEIRAANEAREMSLEG